MQRDDLQVMTVLQLRKLAKEQGVKLSAGIDKSGIVESLLSDKSDETVAEAAKNQTVTPTQNEPSVLCADVTSVSAPINKAVPATTDKPAYRQAWQSRQAPAAPNRPQWPAQRPVQQSHRFGPKTPEANANEKSEEATSKPYEGAPMADGYRLGYKAQTAQRPNYRNNGSSNASRSQYSSSSPQNQTTFSAQQTVPVTQAPTSEGKSVSKDAQFAKQVDEGKFPDLLRTQNKIPMAGIVDISDEGHGYLRSNTLLFTKADALITVAQIRRFHLESGDKVEGQGYVNADGKSSVLLTIATINGRSSTEEIQASPSFDSLTPISPEKRIVLGECEASLRLCDAIAPMGYGQRALITTTTGVDVLPLLTSYAQAIKNQDDSACVMMLLLHATPEDATGIRETTGCECYAPSFATSPETQTRISEIVLSRAKRMVEKGQNVVLLLDSLTKLNKAYQNTKENTIKAKELFDAARNVREGGSLTIIATMDAVSDEATSESYTEFLSAANMSLVLQASDADSPITPMVNLQASNTKKSDKFLTDEQSSTLQDLRRMQATLSNQEAICQWLKG